MSQSVSNQREAEIEHQSWAEICATYPAEYVILFPVDFDEGSLEVRGGVVIAHGPARKNLLVETPRARGNVEAILFTGPVSERFPPVAPSPSDA